MNQKAFFAGASLILGAASATAQLSTASQQADTVQQQQQLEQSAGLGAATNSVPELYAGESSDVGPQSVLQLKPHRTIFTASADMQYFHTDNLLLTQNNRQGADVLVSTVDAVLTPVTAKLGDGTLAPRLGYQQQWFDYGLADNASFTTFNPSIPGFTTAHLNDYDFNVQTVFSDVTWSWQNWIISAGGDYRRLLVTGDYDQFYSEFVPRWSARRVFDLSPATALSLGYEGDYRITDTALTSPGLDSSSYNRTDNSLVLVGSWKVCEHVVLQPYYRFEFSHYTGIRRDDYLNSFGLALYFPVCKNTALRAFVGYDNLDTDAAYANSYENLTAGGGLNLTIGF